LSFISTREASGIEGRWSGNVDIPFWDNSAIGIFGIAVAKSIYSARQEKLQQLLRSVREDADLTQTELAQRLQRPQSYVSKYESGERRLDVLELREICGAVSIPFVRFVERLEKLLDER
jgi:DNA-binding XRE family transcriptional regulator